MKTLGHEFYTKFPNWLLDTQHEYTMPQWCIITCIVRQTEGYIKRDWWKLSINDFVERTGMSRRTVINTLNELPKCILRKNDGNSFSYKIIKPSSALDAPIEAQGVQEMHQGGALDAPVLVQEMHQGGALDAPITSSLKKEERKERNIKEIQLHFTTKNYCHMTSANAGTIQVYWHDPIEKMLDIVGGDIEACKKRIDKAYAVLKQKGYNINSPKSFLNTFSNVAEGADFGETWEVVKAAIANRVNGDPFHVVDESVTQIAKSMYNDIRDMNQYRERELKAVFMSRLQELR